MAAQHAQRKVGSRGSAPNGCLGQRRPAGRKADVPESTAPEYRGISDRHDVGKNGADRCEHPPCVLEWWSISQIGQEHALGSDYPPDLRDRFCSGEIRGHPAAGEGIKHDDVGGARP